MRMAVRLSSRRFQGPVLLAGRLPPGGPLSLPLLEMLPAPVLPRHLGAELSVLGCTNAGSLTTQLVRGVGALRRLAVHSDIDPRLVEDVRLGMLPVGIRLRQDVFLLVLRVLYALFLCLLAVSGFLSVRREAVNAAVARAVLHLSRDIAGAMVAATSAPASTVALGSFVRSSSPVAWLSAPPAALVRAAMRVRFALRLAPRQLAQIRWLHLAGVYGVPRLAAQVCEVLPLPVHVPQHIGVVMLLRAPTHLEPPPPVPAPYVNHDRLIVTPDPKAVLVALARASEHQVAVQAHAGAERVRCMVELARMVLWCTAAGIRELTAYEASGTVWTDLEPVVQAIQAQLVALYITSSTPAVKVVDRVSGAFAVVPPRSPFVVPLDGGHTDYINNTIRGNMYSPVPLPNVVPPASGTRLPPAQSLLLPVPSPAVTVYLASNKDGLGRAASMARAAAVRIHYAREGGAAAESVVGAISDMLGGYGAPALVLRAGAPDEPVHAVGSFPLFDPCAQPVFYARHEPWGFGFFARAVAAYASLVLRDHIAARRELVMELQA